MGYQTRGYDVPNRYNLFEIIYVVSNGQKMAIFMLKSGHFRPKMFIYGSICKLVMWGIKLGDLMSLIYINCFLIYMRSTVAKKCPGSIVTQLQPYFMNHFAFFSYFFINLRSREGLTNTMKQDQEDLV